MTEHTPGPWVYAPDTPHYRHGPYIVWTAGGPGHGWVAVTCSEGLMPSDPDRQAADARLIAQSPELPALCRGVLVALAYPRGSEAQVRCLEEVGQDARRVLASIEGRETV